VKGTRRGATTEMTCRCFESYGTPALAEGQLPKYCAVAYQVNSLLKVGDFVAAGPYAEFAGLCCKQTTYLKSVAAKCQ